MSAGAKIAATFALAALYMAGTIAQFLDGEASFGNAWAKRATRPKRFWLYALINIATVVFTIFLGVYLIFGNAE